MTIQTEFDTPMHASETGELRDNSGLLIAVCSIPDQAVCIAALMNSWQVHTEQVQHLRAEVERLRAENERLKKALADRLAYKVQGEIL